MPPVTRHLSLFGGLKVVVRPDPIPNSAVKHSLADGSSPIGSARVGSRQFFKKSRRTFLRLFAFDAGQQTANINAFDPDRSGTVPCTVLVSPKGKSSTVKLAELARWRSGGPFKRR